MDADGRGITNLLSVNSNRVTAYSKENIVILVAVLILLLFFGAYFACVETAFASVSKTKIKSLADNKNKKARSASFIIENFDKALITILIGSNICHITFSSIATLMAEKIFQNISVTVSTLITTFLVFFLAEMLPKSYAKSNCEKVSLNYASSLKFLMLVLTPLSFFFSNISKILSKIFTSTKQVTVTEEELQDIIETMDEEGSFENDDKGELIQNAMEFDDLTAGDILTSRVDLDFIDINMSTNEILEFVKATNHSRIPVFDKTVDNVVGVLRTRRFLKAYIKLNGNVDTRSLLSKAYFVPYTIKIDSLFEKMTKNKCYLAFVTDEYGGTMGIVTIEDIVEELVGDIWDESDEKIEEIIKLSENEYRILSDAYVGDFLEKIEFEDYDSELSRKSFGMWCGEMLESMPNENDRFTFENIEITVEKVEHNRVVSVKAFVAPCEKGDAEDE